MELLKILCESIIKLNIDDILFEIYEKPEFQQLVGNTNIFDQLFKKGIDSNGNSLGQYAESTIKRKKIKGQPYDRVTLKDMGEFYSTWDIIPQEDGFIITADGRKGSIDLLQKYGNDVLGLTDENLQVIIQLVQDEIIKSIQEKLFKALG